MAQIELWITAFRDALWSPYFLVILLVGTGLLMTIRLRFIQARKLGHSFNLTRGIYDHPDDPLMAHPEGNQSVGHVWPGAPMPGKKKKDRQ